MQVIEDFSPLLQGNDGLMLLDFQRFSRSFELIVNDRFPTARRVRFWNKERCLSRDSEESAPAGDLLGAIETIPNKQEPVLRGPDWFVLRCIISAKDTVVISVEGVDRYVVRKASEDWLEDLIAHIQRDMLLVKQARVNCRTGLLNMMNLKHVIADYAHRETLQLSLIELPPPPGRLKSRSHYRHKCTMMLRQFFAGEEWRLHYLGHDVFCFPHHPEFVAKGLGAALVSYLKKEGAYRVHVGTSKISSPEKPRNNADLLNSGWRALEFAERRGPFSFYDSSNAVSQEVHPLAPLPVSVSRRISRIVKTMERFSLVLFRCEEAALENTKSFRKYFQKSDKISSSGALYYILKEYEGDDALRVTQLVINELKENRDQVDVLAGVCGYPLNGLRKSEIGGCCTKAILHASFYGNAACALFNGLSLNVSGDVYYAEGDLVKAAREYRKGLTLDPELVNLHNSLGVCLAMMNRHNQAMDCFKRALRIEHTNFLALYNLGLAEESMGNFHSAFSNFQAALASFDPSDVEARKVKDDLLFRLGRTGCETSKFTDALTYLTARKSVGESLPKIGRDSFYLGWAYYGLGRQKEAMTVLQRALSFNEFDDRAMHLLAKVYFEAGEGDEIARSLFSKSIELNPDNLEYRISAAEFELHGGNVQQARDLLNPCLRKNGYRNKARLLLADYHEKNGEKKQGKVWLKRLPELRRLEPELRPEYRRLSKKLL